MLFLYVTVTLSIYDEWLTYTSQSADAGLKWNVDTQGIGLILCDLEQDVIAYQKFLDSS